MFDISVIICTHNPRPDYLGRFSVPSRLADYLACGLPVIASTDPGTAIFSFLSSLPQGCAANVADTKALVQAVIAFAGDSACWRKPPPRQHRMPASSFAWKMSAGNCSVNSNVFK
jgi:hypothetical protein